VAQRKGERSVRGTTQHQLLSLRQAQPSCLGRYDWEGAVCGRIASVRTYPRMTALLRTTRSPSTGSYKWACLAVYLRKYLKQEKKVRESQESRGDLERNQDSPSLTRNHIHIHCKNPQPFPSTKLSRLPLHTSPPQLRTLSTFANLLVTS
jgi:hypothetical protein